MLLAAACGLAACEERGEPPAAASAEDDHKHLDAMSREHAEDTTEASAAVSAPARPVHGEMMPYAEVDGQLAHGYLAMPEDVADPLPAIIMIHEWWGLNDNIKAAANQLAGEGYIVLAVDLFGGSVAESPQQAREQMMRVLEHPESGNENVRQAYEFLKSSALAPSRVGVIGWCFGGGWSLNTAMLLPDNIDAAVIYYGQVTDNEDRLRPVRAPILGHLGEKDTGIPLESVEAFKATLESLNKVFDVEIYPGVGHAFANPTGRNYDEPAATKSWEKTLAFFEAHLKNSQAQAPGS
jgi:carboxymethylenebutenolidase